MHTKKVKLNFLSFIYAKIILAGIFHFNDCYDRLLHLSPRKWIEAVKQHMVTSFH